jgi:DNA-binding NtrC family response regulator
MELFRKNKIKNNVNIYIVEDNELDSKVLVQEFELQTNYEIKQFNNGESFLKNLISNPPPKKNVVIIILDYQLNAINIDAKNGIEILRTIKEINREYQVIMISGYYNVDIVTNALHYGAVNFVRKNENIFMRLQNNITWIISQRELKRKRNDSIIMILVFLAVIAMITVATLVIVGYYPELIDR